MFTKFTFKVNGAFALWLIVDHFAQTLIALQWTSLSCILRTTKQFARVFFGYFLQIVGTFTRTTS